MTASDLQKMIEDARAPFRAGVRMDALIDQAILVGMVDGLGGDRPRDTDSKAWADGIRIGQAIARALKSGAK